MNKRGASLLDGILVIVVLFALTIGGFVLNNVFNEADNKIQASQLGTDAKALNQDQANKFPTMLDNFFLILFVGTTIALFIGAFLLQSHPVVFIFSVIILAFIMVIAAILGNAYEDFVGQGEYSSIEGNYTFIPFVFNNFVTLTMVLGLLLIIGLFAKSRGEPI